MISLYLGLEEYLTFYNLLAFHVYLHEKGQFWPRSDLEMVTHMEIQKNQEKSIAFQIEKFSKVSSEITHHVHLWFRSCKILFFARIFKIFKFMCINNFTERIHKSYVINCTI